jgi:hypothetical protein
MRVLSGSPSISVMESREGKWSAVALASILFGYGLFAIQSHRGDSFHSWLLWVASLLGSAAIVMAGLLLRPARLHVGTALIIVGALLAAIPTMWTVILPCLALAVIVLALRDHARAALPA